MMRLEKAIGPMCLSALITTLGCGSGVVGSASSDCAEILACPADGMTSGGTGNLPGDAGSPDQGGVSNDASTTGGGTNAGGAAGDADAAVPECTSNEQCTDPTPLCSPEETCVECLEATDCATVAAPRCDEMWSCAGCDSGDDCTRFTETPECDTGSGVCVECTANGQCALETASRCDEKTCVACEGNTDCAHIRGKTVCSQGICVECTVANEDVCSGKSCDPATNECTTTNVGSVGTCERCVADSECVGGNQADPDRRCVPMMFDGIPRPDGFCLKRVTKGCSTPYGVALSDLSSLSGAAPDTYCGIDQDTTRCEAVLDMVNDEPCANGLDTSCGCARDEDGNCLATGQGGLCETVGAFPNRCTIPCESAAQCLSIHTCTEPEPHCH